MDLQHNIYDGMKWRFTDNGIYCSANCEEKNDVPTGTGILSTKTNKGN